MGSEPDSPESTLNLTVERPLPPYDRHIVFRTRYTAARGATIPARVQIPRRGCVASNVRYPRLPAQPEAHSSSSPRGEIFLLVLKNDVWYVVNAKPSSARLTSSSPPNFVIHCDLLALFFGCLDDDLKPEACAHPCPFIMYVFDTDIDIPHLYLYRGTCLEQQFLKHNPT